MSDLSKLVYKAYLIAEEAHRGQTRFDGIEPYINHPVRVSYRALKEAPSGGPYYTDVQAVSLLHDVIEDTHHTVESLKAEGMGGWADIVDVLTRYPDETYFDYIRKIKKHAQDKDDWPTNVALLVKRADIEDNTVGLTQEDHSSLLRRYSKALDMLSLPTWDES